MKVFQKNKSSFLNKLRQEDGFTLIEVLVVIALIGILAVVSVSLIAMLFDSHIRSNQMLDQQTTIETTYGFMASRLATAQRPIGTTIGVGNNERINPLSIAGDQIMFESQGSCYRIFYREAEKQIRATISGSCEDTQIAPVRGPNEKADNGTYVAQEGDPDYDPALDIPLGDVDSEGNKASFVLASGIDSTRPSNAPGSIGSLFPNHAVKNGDGVSYNKQDQLVLFDYLGEDSQNDSFAGGVPDARAYSQSGNDFYDNDNLSNREDISSIDVTSYVEPIASIGVARVGTRYYQQNLSLQQVCAVPGNGSSGATPGSVYDHFRIDGPGTSNSIAGDPESITLQSAASGNWTPVGLSTTPGQIPAQDAWLQFKGNFTARQHSQPYVLRVVVERDGSNPPPTQTQYYYGLANNTSSWQSLPIQGAFELAAPDSSANAGAQYTVTVEVISQGSGTSLVYNSDDEAMFMDYEIVAGD